MAGRRAGMAKLLRRSGLGGLLDFPFMFEHDFLNFGPLHRQGRRVGRHHLWR
jgi:hypothetical protein